ncbi:endonuclease [Mangrovimonas spongiae]|uniref:T9SS C-terminal target domain-containing protein n=1 Tax=Mangrovimonas spongiae TaxID=2494697 RepID=A0A3R9NS77_9FLAO|nr:endonuclease [Mangrovimonas spongiae]RSK40577.1 T9SS C-terminal target domain-containing protein [Mangrovimonas spongiae]
MNKIVLFSLTFLLSLSIQAQVVINELDCDNPGVDEQEFVELKSDTPNFSLDGYVLVFFNGSSSGNDSSYMAIDLDGYTTDVNGLLLIASDTMTPFPQLIISANTIQNGADAVAIYQGHDYDFPEGTQATQTNLIDALVYDTSDSDDTELMALLGVTEQINEGSSGNTNSIQRNNDGTYTVATPTPRALNDGSGINFNAITISTSQTHYNEGESFDIIFTAEENANADYTFSFTLNNYGFNTSDFTGNTTVTIPAGQNSVTTTITLVDDTFDEGDEEPLIVFSELESPFIPFNNYLKLRVVDNDYTVAPFGTPINPTYNVVESTQPNGYYNSLDGLSDANLRQALQDIIAEEGVVRAQTYNEVIDILKEADENPLNSNQVWLVYLEEGRAKLDLQTGSNNSGKWNREHTFPRSRGGFYSIEDDEVFDGVDVFWNTNADSLRHGNSDAHALRAADGIENSTRGNQFYGEYTGPSGTLGGFKGDVARSVFYMAVRYNGLEIVNGFPDGNLGEFGDLATLLDWHRNDPPDDFEMNRNNVVYNWQFNRNPFIDEPDLIEYIWGNMVGETWSATMSIPENNQNTVVVYPNPTQGQVFIKGLNEDAQIEVFSIEGKKVYSNNITVNHSKLNLQLSKGVYLMQITTLKETVTKKIIIN